MYLCLQFCLEQEECMFCLIKGLASPLSKQSLIHCCLLKQSQRYMCQPVPWSIESSALFPPPPGQAMLMRSTLFLIATGLANADLLRTLNRTVGRCSYTATCIAGGISGVCVDTSAGCCKGSTTSCPGTNDIKCCTRNPCSTPQGSGTCVQTSACSGTSVIK